MLKTVTVYDVTVCLNNDEEFNCLLLSEPTVEALAEAAKLEEDTPSEIVEALAFFREIKLPAKNENEAVTEVTIAGTILGSIRVVPLTAYRQPTKRGPNKKSLTASATDTVDAVETSASSAPTTP